MTALNDGVYEKSKLRTGAFIQKDEMNGNWVNLIEQPKLPGFGKFSKLDLSWTANEPDLKDLEEFEIEVVSRWPSGTINLDYTYLSRSQTIHHTRSPSSSSYNEISLLISMVFMILHHF